MKPKIPVKMALDKMPLPAMTLMKKQKIGENAPI
jgi:hypothetical protein